MLTFLIFFLFLAAFIYVIMDYLMKKRIMLKNKSGNDEEIMKLYKPFPYVNQAKFLSVIFFVIFFLFAFVIVKVGGQDVGVLITPTGVSYDELKTGWHLVAPWNKVFMMDKTVWVYTFSNSRREGQSDTEDAIWTPTKDGIKMGMDISVSWRINENEASWIYQNVSENDDRVNGRYKWIEENIIRPKVKSALALTVSNFSPIEVYSNKRQDIQDLVQKKLAGELQPYKLHLDQVDIREVFYNPEYENAINQKKLAEQEVLRMEQVTRQKEEGLKQANIDKEIAIQKAQGEAEALKIKGTSINANPKIIQLQWIDKWDGKLPTYMLGSGQGIMLSIPQEKIKE